MSNPKFRDVSSGSKSLVLLELIVFASSLLATVYLNNFFVFVEQSLIPDNVLVVYAFIFSLAVQLSALALGLYNSKLRETLRGVLRRLMVSVAIGFFLVTLINPFYGENALAVELLAISSVMSFISIAIVRTIVVRIDFFGFNKRKVLVLGAGDRASIIEKRMRRDVDRQHFDLHGFVIMEGDSENGIKNENRIELDGSLVNYALENDIDEIVVASDERRNNLPVDELFACKIRGVEVTEILDFIERETGQIAVNLIYPSWVIYSNGFASNNHLRNTLDWVFNATMAFFLFVLTCPIMLITALLIKLDEGLKAPIFYMQERVGLDGQAFNIIKFRSMRIDAEKDGAQMAKANDDRTTKIGHVLRKYRIDELPQIINLIKGDMSIIGPRPLLPEYLPLYNETQKKRHDVKPGITGWAQVNGRNAISWKKKFEYDVWYVENKNLLLDLKILLLTIKKAFVKDGISENGYVTMSAFTGNNNLGDKSE